MAAGKRPSDEAWEGDFSLELPATPEEVPSRYVVGIDLGTTNSAVAYVDTAEQPWQIRTFPIVQLVAAGEVDQRDTLPSFYYQPAAGEFPPEALRLPWSQEPPGYVVGLWAREHGRFVAGRVIESAKSWLSHGGVDRTAPLLPWHAADDVQRLSPVEVSARYLEHIRSAWDAARPDEPLARQDVVLTLPASFDEVARELTLQAARQAGLHRVVLIEEPQAAFYSWIDTRRDDWQEHVSAGQKILVCDVGGGTTDFTLIRARRQADGTVQFHRVAVGEHLILGGDNFDLALARDVETRVAIQGKIEPRQWSVLVRNCRHIKELLLGPDAPPQATLHLPASGARLIGGAKQVELDRNQVRALLVDGFFPRVDLDVRPERRQSGFQEFGLPYAADPAITRHLARFLTAHRLAGGEEESAEGHDPARPDLVLFNGGVFASPVLRERLLEVIGRWFGGPEGDWSPVVLENERLDLAVARGAAYYGMVRRGQGVRIAAGLARTYYVEVQRDPPLAVCLLPAGIEPGEDADLSQRTFELSLAEPVEFPLHISSTRLTDKAGELIPIDRLEMSPLPPIRTVLRAGRRREATSVPVHLHARLTEIGTLELWCTEVEGERSWQLQFDVRSATQSDVEGHTGLAEQEGVVERQVVETCRRMVREVFGPEGKQKPGGLPQRMAEAIEMRREDWPVSLLRDIWQALMEVEAGRRKSADHEARWLNLVGFALRPGYGLAVDDWRVSETWRTLHAGLVFPTPMCRTEWRILWRRIAGGLTAGQQETLAAPLLAAIRKRHQQVTTGRGKGADFAVSSHEEAEVWRLLGALELLRTETKRELGETILDLLPKRRMEPVRPALAWTLGRLGARVPVFGPLNGLISAETVAGWVERLMDLGDDAPMGQLAVVQMARRTGDRYRDLPDRTRDRVLGWLAAHGAPDHYLSLVREGGQWAGEEQELIVGESLPRGLRLRDA